MKSGIDSIKAVLLVLCSWLAMAGSAVAAGPAGHWDIGLYGNLFGAREYQVWVPAGYDDSQPLPLLLVLHGCVTGPNLMGEASGFNDVADTEGFIVVYPRQNVTSNPARCWNWQLPINQARDSGEASILAGIVDKVKAGYSVDPHRVYVTGISAGGAMTSIMLACYSDVFAAGAIHSGGMFKGATTISGSAYALLAGSIYSPDSNGRLAWQCSGSPSPRPRWTPGGRPQDCAPTARRRARAKDNRMPIRHAPPARRSRPSPSAQSRPRLRDHTRRASSHRAICGRPKPATHCPPIRAPYRAASSVLR